MTAMTAISAGAAEAAVAGMAVEGPSYTWAVDDAPGDLVRLVAAGDHAAWGRLVQRYNAMVWSIARSFRLGPHDALDVVQTVWLRLVENLERIKDPNAVGTWLATTTRNECLTQLRRRGRQPLPVDTSARDIVDVGAAPPDQALLARERGAVVWAALSRVPEPCQQLLRILAADPPPSYREVSVALNMPTGSIGPTRARCLEKLRLSMAKAPNGDDFMESP
jgi:RNA polymerase sigma factor (sigma-70 family)